jgi:hypothetical protein
MSLDPALIGSAPGAQSDGFLRAAGARARPDAGIQNRRELIKPLRFQIGR